MPANLMWSIRRKVTETEKGKVTERVISGGRVAEAEMLARLNLQLGQRVRLQMPLWPLSKLTMFVMDVIKAYNLDPNHNCEGFDDVTEAEVQPGVWKRIDELQLVTAPTCLTDCEPFTVSIPSTAVDPAAPFVMPEPEIPQPKPALESDSQNGKKTYVLNSPPQQKPTLGEYWKLWKVVETTRPGINRHALTSKALGCHPKVTEMSEAQLAKMISVFSAIVRDSKKI
jgi:hypothetical protein